MHHSTRLARLALSLFLALAAALGPLSLRGTAPAYAQPPWPSLCQESSLPSHDPEFPEPQLILICIPPNWNGQLVVYAHGYVAPQLPLALPTDPLALTAPSILLPQGFAFATTSYHKNGYAVEQARKDIDRLVKHFRKQAPGPLQKVLLVGASMGGLITTMLVERHPDKYAGGLALCGPVGGAPFQIKYQGDFRVVFDYFFPGVFPFGAVDVPPEAFLNWQTPDPLDSDYVAAIATTVLSNPGATAQLFSVTGAALDPADLNSAATSSVRILFYNIFGTNDLIATAGGQPYDNADTLYFGSADDVALNAGVERVQADGRARAYLRRAYQTTGQLQRPLVTLHNLFDPDVPVQHEALYSGLVAAAGSSAFLTQMSVPTYGHCNFTVDQVLVAFELLVQQAAAQTGP
jgi:pimeloyl-ACP methyl ester carboxylesterase